MPYGVNATVDRMQAANSNTMPHAVLVQAGLAQLLHRNHAVLLGRDRGQTSASTADSPLRLELGTGQKVDRRG